jgi:hypothetical protein
VQQPQPIAAEQQAPVGAVVGIEALLQAAVGRAAPALLAEGTAALVELVGGKPPQDQGNSALECPVGDRVVRIAVLPTAAGVERGAGPQCSGPPARADPGTPPRAP